MVGTWRQHRHGNVDFATAPWSALLSVPGVAIGVVVANAVPQRALELGFAALILFVAFRLVRRWPRGRRAERRQRRRSEHRPARDRPRHRRSRSSEIEVRASRSGGPGGQHANKTESRIEAVFDVLASQLLPDEAKRAARRPLGPRVIAVAQDSRSQTRNRELALDAARANGSRAGLQAAQAAAADEAGPGAPGERRLERKRRRASASGQRLPPQTAGARHDLEAVLERALDARVERVDPVERERLRGGEAGAPGSRRPGAAGCLGPVVGEHAVEQRQPPLGVESARRRRR